MDYDDHVDEEWVEDGEDESENDLLVCPSCREWVHEDTQQCPHCGDWITPSYPGEHSKRVWIAVVAVLLIVAFLMLVLF